MSVQSAVGLAQPIARALSRPITGTAAPRLLPVASLLVSLLAAVAVVHESTVLFALFALVLGVLVLRRWPVLSWATMLVATLLFPSYVLQKVVFAAGGMTLYLADLLPVLFIVGGLVGGVRRLTPPPAVRIAVAACAAFCVITLVDWYRSIGANGFSAAMQARHLFPFVMICALPFAKGMSDVRAARVADVLSIASVALAGRTILLLHSGSESLYNGSTRVSNPLSDIGVQRTFQTWEPFIAAAIGLTLLAYVLLARRPSVLHYAGLAATTLPVLFGFFRVAWVFAAILGALTLAIARSERRGKIMGFVLAAVLVFALFGSGSHVTSRYSAQFLKRTGAITTTLDSYRANEYHAVWVEIRKNVVFGQGFGTEYTGDWTTLRSWAHNAYEWLWWRVGLMGLLTFLVVLFASIAAGASTWLRTPNADDRALALGLIMGVAFTGLAANFHLNFEETQNNLFVAFAVAQLLILACRQTESTLG